MKARAWLFVPGVAAVLAAVLSPLDAEATVHFPVHMIQHVIFVLVAAPLLAASGVLAARPRSLVLVALLHAVAMWVWHLPALYDAAMENAAIHFVEHLTFLVTALFFWDAVFDTEIDRLRRVGLVFVTMLQSGALGAIIVFASSPLYDWHVQNPPPGLTSVLEEQQAAGAIMWVPPGVVYLVTMLVLLAPLLSRSDEKEPG